MTSARVIVLGAGSWGTALAIHLAKQQQDVFLWGPHAEVMARLHKERSNAAYLPQIPFSDGLKVSNDLASLFDPAMPATVLITVPSHAFNEMLLKIKPYLSSCVGVVWGTKGLAQDGALLHTLFQQHCPGVPFAVLSGPSFATEVAKGLPTAVTIATSDTHFGEQLLNTFHSDNFRVYLSSDVIGVQLGGALKNVLAIAVGMSDGLGFGANARCALITRGLAELSRLAQKMGAQLNTLMGLSGVGDLVLTCTDNQSRNRRFGLALGNSSTASEAEKAIGQVVEGKANAKQAMLLAKQWSVEMPICEQVYQVLYENLSPSQAVANLMQRSPKNEF